VAFCFKSLAAFSIASSGLVRVQSLCMIQDIKEAITVKTVYDHKNRRVYPTELLWNGNYHKIKKIGLHYPFRNGGNLFHVFTVSTDVLSFKLQLDTSNLFWTVEQISDGLPD